MPNYKVHDKIANISAPVIMSVTYYYFGIEYAIVIGATFSLANHYLSPDLDIDSIMNRRWGVLYFIWYPYKRMFSHRSFWTHSGPISATIRFVYLLVWLLPIFYFITPPGIIFIILWISMVLADSIHTTADKIL